MAAYGSGYYGGGNYSFGVSLGAAEITSTSSVTAAGFRTTFGAFAVLAESSVVVNAIRIAFMSASVASDSIIEIGSNVVVNQGFAIDGTSTMTARGVRITRSLAPISCTSVMAIAAVLKWNINPDTPETWTGIPDTSETWTPVTQNSEVWTAV